MYLFVVILIVTLLAVIAYVLYIKQKGDKLNKIERGFCPECDKKSIELKRVKGGGCSGTKNIIYRCTQCGYEEEFNIQGGGCGL